MLNQTSAVLLYFPEDLGFRELQHRLAGKRGCRISGRNFTSQHQPSSSSRLFKQDHSKATLSPPMGTQGWAKPRSPSLPCPALHCVPWVSQWGCFFSPPRPPGAALQPHPSRHGWGSRQCVFSGARGSAPRAAPGRGCSRTPARRHRLGMPHTLQTHPGSVLDSPSPME